MFPSVEQAKLHALWSTEQALKVARPLVHRASAEKESVVRAEYIVALLNNDQLQLASFGIQFSYSRTVLSSV